MNEDELIEATKELVDDILHKRKDVGQIKDVASSLLRDAHLTELRKCDCEKMKVDLTLIHESNKHDPCPMDCDDKFPLAMMIKYIVCMRNPLNILLRSVRNLGPTTDLIPDEYFAYFEDHLARATHALNEYKEHKAKR